MSNTLKELINKANDNKPLQVNAEVIFIYKGSIYKVNNILHKIYNITDLTNAGKRGKQVYMLTVRFNNSEQDNSYRTFQDLDFELIHNIFSNTLLLKCEYSKIPNFNTLVQTNFTTDVNVYFSTFNANNVMAQDLSLYKPLKEVPKKWTIRHVARVLINKQYKNLVCNGVYTDDYAYDKAVNFNRDEIDNLKFAKKLIENSSGWSAWATGNKINVCCYSFDNNSFELCL